MLRVRVRVGVTILVRVGLVVRVRVGIIVRAKVTEVRVPVTARVSEGEHTDISAHTIVANVQI